MGTLSTPGPLRALSFSLARMVRGISKMKLVWSLKLIKSSLATEMTFGFPFWGRGHISSERFFTSRPLVKVHCSAFAHIDIVNQCMMIWYGQTEYNETPLLCTAQYTYSVLLQQGWQTKYIYMYTAGLEQSQISTFKFLLIKPETFWSTIHWHRHHHAYRSLLSLQLDGKSVYGFQRWQEYTGTYISTVNVYRVLEFQRHVELRLLKYEHSAPRYAY